eukprot:NODE_7027_length_1616_cov_4.701813.p1 GENE.NODE_7027_length_1616_cov_4.701813~~NODE_7027_length_1616_cov_4.701813.p1  ORF type:complete len:493 (+),score=168.00 NODE_7027_length_1616_cov_4.701813:23-1480(+)
MAAPAVPPPAADWLIAKKPFDTNDKLVDAACLHFRRLQEDVFLPLGVVFGGGDGRGNTFCGRAFVELQRRAMRSEEDRASVCLALIYALLVHDWCSGGDSRGVGGRADGSDGGPGGGGGGGSGGGVGGGGDNSCYSECLTAACALDGASVVACALLGFAQRCYRLHAPCHTRLLFVLGDAADARWPGIEHAVLALQREVRPGDARPAAAELLVQLLRWLLGHTAWLVAPDAAKPSAAPRLTFLWALRWASSLRQPVSAELEAVAEELSAGALQLAADLWQRARAAVLDAGPLLLWALMHCRTAPSVHEVWSRAADAAGVLLAAPVPNECLNHLVTEVEAEELAFIVAEANVPGAPREARLIEWFASRHLAGAGSADAHMADVVLWALHAAEAAGGGERTSLWCRLWNLGRARAETHLAFLFAAACGSAYARGVLTAALAADTSGSGARARARELAAAHMPAAAARILEPLLADADAADAAVAPQR